MKKISLLLISMLLISCGGGDSKEDEDPCFSFCVDLCNKAYVCGLSVECSQAKMDNCVRGIPKPWECQQDRIRVIGMSCNELRGYR